MNLEISPGMLWAKCSQLSASAVVWILNAVLWMGWVALLRDASWVKDKTGRWDVQVWTAGSNHAQTHIGITSIEDKTCWTWFLIGIHYGIHGKPCTWCSFLSSWEHNQGFAVLDTLDNPIEGIRIIWMQWEFHIFILLNLALVLSRLSPRWCDPSRALASCMSGSTWEGRRGCCLTLRPSSGPWQWGSCGGKFLHWTNNRYLSIARSLNFRTWTWFFVIFVGACCRGPARSYGGSRATSLGTWG